MRHLRSVLWLLVALGAIAIGLLAMLGMFWILEIAPLIIFVGMAIAYGLLSSSTSPHRAPKPSTNAVLEDVKRSNRS